MNMFWVLLSSSPHRPVFSQPTTGLWLKSRCRPTMRAQRAWRRQSPWWDRWKSMASRTQSWVIHAESSQTWTCRSRKTRWRSPQKVPVSSASSSRCWCSRDTAQVSWGQGHWWVHWYGIIPSVASLQCRFPASGFIRICLQIGKKALHQTLGEPRTSSYRQRSKINCPI